MSTPIRPRRSSKIFKNSMPALKYGNVIVTYDDFSLLFGPKWINDALISFVFEYYRIDIYKKQAKKVAFVPPEVTQIIKLNSDDDEILNIVHSLELTEKDLVFFPINDGGIDSEGTHWSLLVWFKFGRGELVGLENINGSNNNNRSSSASSTISSSNSTNSSSSSDGSINVNSHNNNSSTTTAKTNQRIGHFVHFDSLEDTDSTNIDSAKTVAARLSSCQALPSVSKKILNSLKQNDNDHHQNSSIHNTNETTVTTKTRTSNRITEKNQKILKELTLAEQSRLDELVSEDENFPKQTNTYDCGLYVILAVTVLAESFRNPNCGFTTNDVNPRAIQSLRQQLIETIEKEYEKRSGDDKSTSAAKVTV